MCLGRRKFDEFKLYQRPIDIPGDTSTEAPDTDSSDTDTVFSLWLEFIWDRDLNKELKKVSRQKAQSNESDDHEIQESIVYRQHWLPWLLLFLTWLGVGIYFLV